ncbi:LacI family DNA-binding transcriptional regulator [Thermoanaerobacterium thermosaccharolyticum]|uniref:Transcriptional regulator n=1 Tax=Thermoanaerobacterium thermosaccharolyticum M0795 TaxID=698948 RepID=L0IGH3_THETR|nr:LacI family DNA-binding transcriptional regulator [Thermoanaerobacterium thermosaccharolyticum]AGB17938.1 transcriptional regulator [Thermoanaerobacterium thermosaccharolyticum M0795]
MGRKKDIVTIRDIAKEANVSVTTVTNVIHKNYGRVSQETINRIEKIIKEKQYIPNMSARSLVNNSSKIIGVINNLIPEINSSFIQDPFHSAFIGGIEKEFSKSEYFTMIRTVMDEQELITLLKNWNLDGIILTGVFDDEFYHTLKMSEIPIVLIDSYIEDEKILSVGLEDFNGGYIATKYLIENGHKNILFVSPKIKANGVVEERLKGYEKALNEAGLLFNKNNVYEHETAITIDECINLGRKLSNRRDVTAIFATADIMAVGIMSGLQEMGVRIPDDISIIGFDDLDISRITSPRLTTIHQDAEKKGLIAAEMMITYLKEHNVKNRKVILPVHLVERESVRKIL